MLQRILRRIVGQSGQRIGDERGPERLGSMTKSMMIDELRQADAIEIVDIGSERRVHHHRSQIEIQRLLCIRLARARVRRPDCA